MKPHTGQNNQPNPIYLNTLYPNTSYSNTFYTNTFYTNTFYTDHEVRVHFLESVI